MRTFLCVTLVLSLSTAMAIELSEKAAADIGRKIWQNESGGSVSGLTAWNSGEDFPSLGIGHFIWYPRGKEGPFEESFPKLVDFLKRRGIELPRVVRENRDAPWSTKADFDQAQGSAEMRELRGFLARTVPEQTAFIVARLEAALPKMLEAVPPNRRGIIRDRFHAVASTPNGIYALIDYVNFKGEGTKSTERYNGEGWGLLQVLDNMNGSPKSEAAVREFATSAKRTLAQRVKNSPPARGESRWLKGWHNRIDTYTR